ncbi:uncharacterized protein [Dysidea avara]|uniref:uncharacterized protein n=1 Tax=Dysidea avara TaxID=196820 RepID=UPI0033317972
MLKVVTIIVLFVVTCSYAKADDKATSYHQLMTPYWLSKHAELFGSYTVHPDYLHFLAGSSNERLIRVPLVPPKNLSKEDDITVTITVAMDTVWADANVHDPVFGISDGDYFVGFITLNNNYYSSYPPCYRAQGRSYDTSVGVSTSYTGVTRPTGAKSYSSEVKMHIKPTEKWGSCHTEHDEGHIAIAQYSYKLDVTKGLYFDMHRSSSSQTYRVEYILVEVY